MSNLPLVSIVTPSFNQASFIENCILSVINQDYPHIEYIIFDGGSTDGSIDIIKKYESKLTFWKTEKDRGQSHAINKGWEMSKGELLFYLNSDDLLCLPNAISKIVKLYQMHPQGSVFYGDCKIIDENGNFVKLMTAKPATTQILTQKRIFADLFYQTAAFFNAKYLKETGFLEENLHYSMDLELVLRLSTLGEMYSINEPIACFRTHKDQKSNVGVKYQNIESAKIKARYNKLDGLIHLFHHLKFLFFLQLPIFIQKRLKPALYERYKR
ncbi:MAG: glycosyltransferase family 2 protein [Cytophagales bacterium]